jgi:hypothetical protein
MVSDPVLKMHDAVPAPIGSRPIWMMWGLAHVGEVLRMRTALAHRSRQPFSFAARYPQVG